MEKLIGLQQGFPFVLKPNCNVLYLENTFPSFETFLVKRNQSLIKIFKRNMLLGGGKKGAQTAVKVVGERKSVTLVLKQEQHTVYYSPDKEENKPNPEPLQNWVSDRETRDLKPGVKESLAKYPVKHPKVGVDELMKDPEQKKQLNIAFTHKLPSKTLQEKYDFKTLSSELLGKDPKNGKPHYLIITNRVTNTKEIRSAPANPELTNYLKSHPRYPDIVDDLIANALDTLKNEKTPQNIKNPGVTSEKDSLTEKTPTKEKEKHSFTQESEQSQQKNLYLPLPEKEQNQQRNFYLPLAEIKPLQITSGFSVSPAFSMAEKAPSVRENLEKLAQKRIAYNSHGTLPNESLKKSNQPNETIDKHIT